MLIIRRSQFRENVVATSQRMTKAFLLGLCAVLLAALLVVNAVLPTSACAAPFIAAVPVLHNSNPRSPVLLYKSDDLGHLNPLTPIPGMPNSSLNSPYAATFSGSGELFASNRHYPSFDGSISRFLLDASGTYTANGVIVGNGLSQVHGMDFSPNNELFAVSHRGSLISRFTFDASGNAIPNGVVAIPIPGASTDHANIGVTFSPWGELFVSVKDNFSGTEESRMHRYVFDELGNAIYNGYFSKSGNTWWHGMEFDAAGELFIPDLNGEVIDRYVFDDNLQPMANGIIPVVGAHPAGVAFTPDGEMFVSNEDTSPSLWRFVFDDQGNAILNGQISTGTLLGQIAILPLPLPVPEPSSLALFTLASIALWLANRRNVLKNV